MTNQDLSFLIFALFRRLCGGFRQPAGPRPAAKCSGSACRWGLVNVITLVVLQMLEETKLPDLKSVIAALLSGIACAFGTLVLLVLFERMFGIITDLRLLELTGLRNPLIAQFEEKGPRFPISTCSMWSKLAEAAAQAISANYLLVRARGLTFTMSAR